MEPASSGLGGKYQGAGAGKMRDHLAGADRVCEWRHVVTKARHFPRHFDLAVVIGHDLDPVAGFAAVRIPESDNSAVCGVPRGDVRCGHRQGGETNKAHLMLSNTARAWIKSTVLWPLVNQP